jgi:hypothetical protein
LEESMKSAGGLEEPLQETSPRQRTRPEPARNNLGKEAIWSSPVLPTGIYLWLIVQPFIAGSRYSREVQPFVTGMSSRG